MSEPDLTEEHVRAAAATNPTPSLLAVFRNYDATAYKANTIELPAVSSMPTSVSSVDEGEEMPSTSTDYTKQQVDMDKFGIEVSLYDDDEEAVADMFDHYNASQAAHAVDEIRSCLSRVWMRDATVNNVLVRAYEAGCSNIEFSGGSGPPFDTMVVPRVLGDQIAENDPTRDWDEIASDFGHDRDIRVITDEYNVLGAGEILAVDTELFGYEVKRSDESFNTYTVYEEHDPARHVNVPEEERTIEDEVVQMHRRVGFAVISQEAGARLYAGRME